MKRKFLQVPIMALCGALILGSANANENEKGKAHNEMKPKVGMDCGQGCDCYTNVSACNSGCCSVGR